MKDEILEYLNKTEKAYSEIEIKDFLKTKDLEEVCDNLRELELEGKIHFTKSQKYIAIKNTSLKIGRLQIKKSGFGFLLLENEDDIFISESNLNGAIHNDLVAVDNEKVVKIIERDLKQFSGEVVFYNNEHRVILDNKLYKMDIVLENEDRLDAVEGSKVMVKPYEKVKGNIYKGKVLKVYGHKNDPKTDILSIIYEKEIEPDFHKESLEEIESIKFVLNKEDYLNRRDLTNKKIFTIDGDDAKDFDDAMSIETLSNGNVKVGIHIADVSYYIKENGSMDKEIINRGTSVYLANTVIPMIPHKLSNDICSLRENVDRLCLSLDVELDSEAKVISYDIYQSVINSKKRMTYKNVNEILEKNNIVSGYEDFVNEIRLLNKYALKLRTIRSNKGGLDFNIPEVQVILDDNEEPIDIVLRETKSGERLIEDFMILANEVVAEHVFNLDMPFIYRVHEKAELEKIKNFLTLLNSLGYQFQVKIKKMTSKDMKNIIDTIKNDEIFPILSEFAVRTTKKAEYRVDNLGHFGLASRNYCHFTAPIRRSPDYMVHKLLKKYISGKNISYEELKELRNKLIYISEQASYKERKAIECEREVNDMLFAKYMQNKIGEEYNGIIAGMIPTGMFVRLDNYVEGMVRIDSVGDDYYYFDEKNYTFIGKRKKKKYKLGDKVKVKVKSACKETRTVDFELINKR